VPKSNYINPRFYQNERTISLNPSKPFNHKRRKPKSHSFLKSLVLVIAVFTAFIGYSVYANASEASWEIKKSKDGEVVFISKHGKINNEDRLMYIMFPDDCNDLVLTFSVSSQTDYIAQDDMRFKVNITEEPYYEYQQSVDVLANKLTEYGHKTNLGFPHIFNFQEHISKIENINEIEIKIISTDDSEHVAAPEEIFDVRTNRWDLDDIANKLREGRHLCAAMNLMYEEV
jgi:hypothetical protein